MFDSWEPPVTPSATDAAAFERATSLLRAADPMPAITEAGGPDGLRLEEPDAVQWRSWDLVFEGGQTVLIAPSVMECPPSPPAAPCAAVPDDVVANGVPVHAPGLLDALRSITSGTAQITPLTVTPPQGSPGAALHISGVGWIGPVVRLTLLECGGPADAVWDLGSAPVTDGRFTWSGTISGTVTPGVCTVSAKDGVREYDATIQVHSGDGR